MTAVLVRVKRTPATALPPLSRGAVGDARYADTRDRTVELNARCRHSCSHVPLESHAAS
jgi:hypothetical protein